MLCIIDCSQVAWIRISVFGTTVFKFESKTLSSQIFSEQIISLSSIKTSYGTPSPTLEM